MNEPNYGRGYVYDIKYHLVWCTKYRKKVLTGEVETELKSIIQEHCDELKIELIEMETDQDRIHLLLGCRPQHYIPDFVKKFKGQSARRLFKTFPELKNQLGGGHLWNPSYYISSASEHTQAQIEKYIRDQQVK